MRALTITTVVTTIAVLALGQKVFGNVAPTPTPIANEAIVVQGDGGAVQPASGIEFDADGAPVSLPIGSLSQLKGWALEQVTEGYIGVGATTMVNTPGSVTNFSLEKEPGESTNQFASRLANQKFSFSLTDTRDWVSVYSSLRAGRDAYFEGTAFTKVQELPDGRTGFRVEAMGLQMTSRVRFPAGSIKNAVLYHRDQWGNIQYIIPLRVYDGYLDFKPSYAGTGDEIRAWVQKPDGGYKEVSYEAKDGGGRIVPTAVFGTTNGALDNTFDFNVVGEEGVTTIFSVIGELKWGNTPPVARIVVGGTKDVDIRVLTRLVGYNGDIVGVATSANLRREGAGLETTVAVPVNSLGNLSLKLTPGVYYLGLDSELFRDYLPQPSVEDGNNGGKGGPQTEPDRG